MWMSVFLSLCVCEEKKMFTKDLSLVSIVSCVRGCVSVFATFGSVLSVGDGILFLSMMSAAAQSHGPASTQGSQSY